MSWHSRLDELVSRRETRASGIGPAGSCQSGSATSAGGDEVALSDWLREGDGAALGQSGQSTSAGGTGSRSPAGEPDERENAANQGAPR